MMEQKGWDVRDEVASPRCPARDDVMVGIASIVAEMRVFRTRGVMRIPLEGSSNKDQHITSQWPLS